MRELTQTALAKKCGISQGSLAHFESGKSSPSVHTLLAMAEALEISPAIFFNSEDVLVFDVKKIQAKYKSLDAMPDRLYRDLTKIFFIAKKLGLE